jgi:hypothetical protein
MSVNQRPGSYPHVRWLDLKANGVMIECAIMKEDPMGNIYYMEIGSMDGVDKSRLVKILTNRNAGSFELWDLMSQMTLNNGVNALTYFHQLVKIITPAGVIMNPRGGAVGTGKVDLNPKPEAGPQGDFKVLNQPVKEAAPPPPAEKASTRKKAAPPA